MIPAFDPATGRLPFRGDDAPWPATFDEVRERFVDQAQGGPARLRLWRAFEVWLDEVRNLLPGATLWISGGFVTARATPTDLDVVVLLRADTVQAATGRPDLWTQQAVIVSAGQQTQRYIDRLQPMGAMIDAHVSPEPQWMPRRAAAWQASWSTEFDKTTHTETGVRMGYLEVRL